MPERYGTGATGTTTREVIATVPVPAQGGAMQTDTDTTTELARTIDTHLAAYCEPDAERRAQLLAEVWIPCGRLTDPPFAAADRAEIAALVDAVLAHYPGHTFARTSEVDAHHGTARYRWELRDPSGAAVLHGLDVATLTDAGKLAAITGFFGDPAALEAR
jgi:hypothetical protein